MAFEFTQRGFGELGGRLRRMIDGLEHPEALVNMAAADLAQMWRDNIDAGANERWDPPSPGLRRTRGEGTPLVVTGAMRESILAAQTGPGEATVGSSLEVGGGYNLLAIQEFGVDSVVSVGALTRRAEANPLGRRRGHRDRKGEGFERRMHIPRRPTSPFDWDAGELTPEGQAAVEQRVEEYVGGLVGE